MNIRTSAMQTVVMRWWPRQENNAELFQRFFSQDFSNPKIKRLTQQFLDPED